MAPQRKLVFYRTHLSSIAEPPQPMLFGTGSMIEGPPKPMLFGPRSTIEEVFDELKARRAAIVQALTTDEALYEDYHREQSSTFTFVFSDGYDPLILPEPKFCIDFPPDLPWLEWVSFLSSESNSWLKSSALYYCTICAFNDEDRNKLFALINNLPTIDQETTEIIKMGKPYDILPIFPLSLSVSFDVLLDDIVPLFGPKSSVEDVFKDYAGRRDGIINALVIESTEFFDACSAAKGEILCLVGKSDASWEVLEPTPGIISGGYGIQFTRDDRRRQDWLLSIAIHSDCWLISLAHYLGTFCAFGKTARMQLLKLINGLPTVYEEVAALTAGRDSESTTPEEASTEEEYPGLCAVCRLLESKTGQYPQFQCYVCDHLLHADCCEFSEVIKGSYRCPTCKL